jgi:hypothetical protein
MTKLSETPTISTEKCQEHEAGKNENMKGSCGLVARLLPLTQPKFQDPSQSHQWLVKAQIPLASNERYQALGHNVGET